MAGFHSATKSIRLRSLLVCPLILSSAIYLLIYYKVPITGRQRNPANHIHQPQDKETLVERSEVLTGASREDWHMHVTLIGQQLLHTSRLSSYDVVVVGRASILYNDNTTDVRTIRSRSCLTENLQQVISRNTTEVAFVQFLSQDDNYESTLCMIRVLEVVKTSDKLRYLGMMPEDNMSSTPAALQVDTLWTYRQNFNVSGSILYFPPAQNKPVDRAAKDSPHSASVHEALTTIVTFISDILKQDTFDDRPYVKESPRNDSGIVIAWGSLVASRMAQLLARHYSLLGAVPLDLCTSYNTSTNEQCLDLLQPRFLQQTIGSVLIPTGQQDYVFTSYFSSVEDPQRRTSVPKNSFEYITAWYLSLKSNQMQAVIFHDGLSEAFMTKMKRDYSKIEFERCELTGRSTNDARFYAYLAYLRRHPYIERILCADISDVIFQQNPFELMTLLGSRLYIGRDQEEAEFFADDGWMQALIRMCKFETSGYFTDYKNIKKAKYMYNAGVIGGDRALMLEFLTEVTKVLSKTPHHHNCNMAAVNYVAHKYFDDVVMTGFPLTNFFKHGRKDYLGLYVIHK